MLEDRALRDAELVGDRFDLRAQVAVLAEPAHRGVQDLLALGRGALAPG
jgi:hypothetical protein